METAATRASSRLIRALVAGGVLAGGWFIADLALSAEPAAAAAQVDLIPGADTPVTDLVDTVLSVAPVATPVVDSLTPVLDPVVGTADAVVAPLAPVTIPILDPVREVSQPVVDTVVAPVLEGTVEVLEPVLTPVVDLVPVIESIVGAAPVLVASITQPGGILSGDGGPVVSIALLGALVAGAVSVVPGGPLGNSGRSPLAPDGTSPSASFFGEILSWIPSLHGTPAPASTAPWHPHTPPVFASGITPD